MDPNAPGWEYPVLAHVLIARDGQGAPRPLLSGPARAQEVRGHLGPPVAGEGAFEVHHRRAHSALTGLEIGEIPHVHSCHERPLRRDVEEAT